MRICFYGDFDSLHTRRWVDYFIRKGHEIHVLSDEPLVYPGTVTHLCEVKGRVPFRWIERFFKLRRIINQEIKPDIVHTHFVTHYGYGGALSGFHPFVLTAWGSDLYVVPERSQLDLIMTRFALGRADLVTVDSQDLGRKATKLGADASKIHLIQFGVEPEKFKGVEPSRLRAELGIPSDAFVVLSMRNLKPLYNHDIVIRAAEQIVSELPNCYFLIVGKGEQKEELSSLIKNLQLENNVFVLDEQPPERVSEFLALADIFVSVPSSDATSVTLLEAMASERPVIVSDLPSNREWITEGENGLIIPPRSPEKLAESVIRLMKDKNTRTILGKRDAEIVVERADHKVNMAKMEELYFSLVTK